MITRRPPSSTQRKTSSRSDFVKGTRVRPTMTSVAGFGPLKLKSDDGDSRQRATARRARVERGAIRRLLRVRWLLDLHVRRRVECDQYHQNDQDGDDDCET